MQALEMKIAIPEAKGGQRVSTELKDECIAKSEAEEKAQTRKGTYEYYNHVDGIIHNDFEGSMNYYGEPNM